MESVVDVGPLIVMDVVALIAVWVWVSLSAAAMPSVGVSGCWRTALRRQYRLSWNSTQISTLTPHPHFAPVRLSLEKSAGERLINQNRRIMSAPPYRQPGQYDETGEVERRLQEE